MKQRKVMLWYDVEDFITPEADDALLALIDMMESLGIRASFKFVAEKIRVLRERGREDILSRLASHEICYHTENHSVHPTQTEYLEHIRGFADGVKEFEKRERQGFLDVMDISGQFPTSYGQPGASWAPQVFPVLKKWGIPTYVDSHYILSVDEGPFWYGGILNLTRLWSTMRVEFDEGGVEAAKERFGEIEHRAADNQLVSIFYHPCEFSCIDFWDAVNFSRGENPPREQWKTSPLRTKEEMMERVGQLREFLEWTLAKPDVEFITAAESLRYEKADREPLTPADVRSLAAAMTSGPEFATVRDARSLCPSEVMSLFARQILGRHLVPDFAYGPEEDVPSEIVEPVTPTELAAAAFTQFDHVLGYRMLPVQYTVGENRISPLDLFMNLRRAVAEGANPGVPMTLTGGEGTLIPAAHINTSYDWAKNWIIFPDGLDASNLVRHAKLQCWTLKPALY